MAKKFISQFTGEEIDERLASVDEKVGGSFFDSTSNTIYFFKSIEDRDEWVDLGMPPTSDLVIFTQVLSFEGEVKKIDIEVDGGLLQYYTTTASSAPIKLHYYSKVKGITDAEWEYIPESADVTISVQKAGSSTEELVYSGSLQSSLQDETPNVLTIDIKQFIAVGSNTVKVVVRGKTSETEAKTNISATLTTMSLYANDRFNWHLPCLQTGSYQLGGFFYTGNIQKTLNVRIANYDGNGAEAVFTKSLGYDTATDVPDSFTLNESVFTDNNYEFPTTGVHKVDVWLTAGTVKSEVLSYDIIFVRSEDVNSAQLVCVNDIAKTVQNGIESRIFSFALYDGVNVYSTETTQIKLYNGDVEVVALGSELTEVATQTKVWYEKLVDVSSDDNEFNLSAQVAFAESVGTAIIKVDNSANFPAESGAVFYFNAANRTNQDAQRERVLDEANNKYIDGNVYEGFSWVDGMDGYTVDDEGNRCFRVPAGSRATLNVAPFASVSTADGVTVELTYKVVNAANETDDVITIYDDTLNAESGLKIKPTNVLLHSSLLHTDKQQYNTKDEEIVHMIVSLVPNHTVNGRVLGYGIAQIYVNGGKKRLFKYDPSATQSWGGASKVVIGSPTADIFLYKMRIYQKGFVWKSSALNYINSRPTRDEKSALEKEIKSIINESYDIDYHKCVAEGKNVMVIEMLGGAHLPDLLHDPGDDGVKCNVLFNFPDVDVAELDDDFKYILHGGADNWQTNKTMEGQGSTAMTYHRWNFRWKKLLGADGETERRITAKKNVASSMQDHKMGATRMYNDVYFHLLNNGKMGDTSIHYCPRTTVYQYPAFGFEKVLEGDEYVYKFIGLYTVGPDKGDKLLFDFKNKTYKDSLLHMEGADHTPRSVGFEYPWKAMDYLPSEEALGAIASKLSDGTTSAIEKAWEVGAAGSYEVDADKDKVGIMEMLTNEFKPAYEVAYDNSPFLIGLTSEEFQEMTTETENWRLKKVSGDSDYNGRSYTTFEFYEEGVYDLYYYNGCDGTYQPTGLNVRNDLGLTDSEIASRFSADGTSQYLFREKRRERFVRDWGTYWHKEDTIYHYAMMGLIAATDNYKKNTYPYKFASLADGGKWRWRQDDLDTIFDVDNSGLSKKSYDILVGDTDEKGDSLYKGDDSVFWSLVKETQNEAIEAMLINILDAMCELAGTEGGVKIEQILAYIDKTFWQKAQRYFGVAGYNEDSEWTYEESQAINPNTAVPPLDQASGDHFEAEYNWVFRRILFYASLLRYGTFSKSAYMENVFGQIQFRASASQTLDIIPSISMTPVMFVGESKELGEKKRVFAGETLPITIEVASSADTILTIPAADYLADIGDFSGVKNANNEGLNLSAKRLRRLKMGGEIPEGQTQIVNNFSNLTINNAPSLEELNCKNCWNLQGVINLSTCKRIKSVDVSGTKVSSITFPEGCKVTSLSLPQSYVNLTLKRFPKITMDSIVFDDIKTLNTLVLESNPMLNGFELLKRIYTTEGHLLKNISVVGFDINVTGNDISLLADIATSNDGQYYTYQGVSGTTDKVGEDRQNPPVINGTLNATTSLKAYEADVDVVNKYYDANIVDYTRYVPFEDAEVRRIVSNKWGDRIGVTESDIRDVKYTEGVFKESSIRTFDELAIFPSLTLLESNDFRNCANLERIDLTQITRLGYDTFTGCVSLIIDELDMPNLISLQKSSFSDVRIRTIKRLGNSTVPLTLPASDYGTCLFGQADYIREANLDYVHSFGANVFHTCVNLTKVSAAICSTISTNCFRGCSSLNEINAPKVTRIDSSAFRDCISLGSVEFPNATVLVSDAFYGCSKLTSIAIPNIEQIGYGSFDGTSLNGELDFENLVSVGERAFRYTNVKSFKAENVTTIGSFAFYGCASLTEVDAPNATSLGSSVCYECAILQSFNAPSVTEVGGSSFYGCSNLTKVRLGKLSTINSGLFNRCSNLNDLNLESITDAVEINSNAFGRTTSFTHDLEFPHATYLGQDAFAYSGIKSIKALSVKNIGQGVFNSSAIVRAEFRDVTDIGLYVFNGATSLKTLIIRNVNPPTTADSMGFPGIANLTIYVPDEAVDTYKAATNWSASASKIKGLSELKE